MFPAQPGISSQTCGKDTKLAINYRDKGNGLFRQEAFFQALEFYNKSLMLAVPNSLEISFAYANRSAVYLELNEFQLCLDNIQLAIDSDYPVEKMETLKDREEKCKKMMESEMKSDDDDPWTFFKLSYPANEKIPFIAGCLELRQDEKFGRQIVTNRDLKPGDIIAIEEPFLKIPYIGNEHLRCTNCLKSNKMNLIPSEILETVMFCSKECMKKAEPYLKEETKKRHSNFYWRVLYKSLDICGGSFEKLKEIMRISCPELSNKSVFDFDFSNSDDPLFDYNLLLSVNSLKQEPMIKNDHADTMVEESTASLFEDLDERHIAKAFMTRFFQISQKNAFAFSWLNPSAPHEKVIGKGIFPFGSLINHSCISNVSAQVVDNKFVFYAKLPIAKGNQLLISYGPAFSLKPLEARQKELKHIYDFDCSCEACVGDYPTIEFSPEEKKWSENIGSGTIAEFKEEFKKNCEKIAENLEKTAMKEIVLLVQRNKRLLSAIAKCEPFTFLK